MTWQAVCVIAASVVCSLSAAWHAWWTKKVEQLLEEQDANSARRWQDVVDLAREVNGLRERLRRPEQSPPSQVGPAPEGRDETVAKRLEGLDRHVSELWRSMIETSRVIGERLQTLEKPLCERRSNYATTGRDGPASTS